MCHDAQENELSNDVAQVVGVRIGGRLLEVRGRAHDARHARRRRVRLLCRGDLRRGRVRLVGVERIHDRTDAPDGLLRPGDVERRAHLVVRVGGLNSGHGCSGGARFGLLRCP